MQVRDRACCCCCCCMGVVVSHECCACPNKWHDDMQPASSCASTTMLHSPSHTSFACGDGSSTSMMNPEKMCSLCCLSPDLVRVLAASSLDMVAGIGAALAETSLEDSSNASPMGPSAASKRAGQTVSSRFSTQLRELVAMLDTTGLHFVRCIKPNGALRPRAFEYELVLQQLRCCGVLEVARVSRAGFPTRYTHGQFVERYKVLLPPEQQSAAVLEGRGVLGAVQQLLAAFRVQEGQYEMGRTKIFFRPGACFCRTS